MKELNQSAGQKERKNMKRRCMTEKCSKTKRGFRKDRKKAWGLTSKALFELDYFYPWIFCNMILKDFIHKYICVITKLSHHTQHHVTQ